MNTIAADRPHPGNKRLLAWTAAGLVLVILVSVWSCLRERDYSNTRGAVAEYRDFRIKKNPLFGTLITGYGDRIATIYVQLPDGQTYFLPELPESVAAQVLRKSDANTAIGTGNNDYYDNHSALSFRDGKLWSAALDDWSGLFRIAARKEGPYLKLPINRAELIREFGEPVSWGRPTKPPSGP